MGKVGSPSALGSSRLGDLVCRISLGVFAGLRLQQEFPHTGLRGGHAPDSGSLVQAYVVVSGRLLGHRVDNAVHDRLPVKVELHSQTSDR